MLRVLHQKPHWLQAAEDFSLRVFTQPIFTTYTNIDCLNVPIVNVLFVFAFFALLRRFFSLELSSFY